jgi:hypothetical protein
MDANGTSRLAVVAAVNDEATLARNLAASPLIASGRAALTPIRGARCASAAYNAGLDATDAPLVVFAHQDVWLPPAFEAGLAAATADLDQRDPAWAVLGVFGTTAAGRRVGRVWSSGIGRCVGEPVDAPTPVVSVDELVIVLRRDAGLRFDPTLPHFHLYGTDIVQTALAAGRGAWAATLPVVHNSRYVPTLSGGFTDAYRHMRRKWRAALPIATPVTRITASGLDLMRSNFRLWRTRRARAAAAFDCATDPREIARACGWLEAAPTPETVHA